MNEYCKHKVLDFYQSFSDRLFDQDDVAMMIVLTRDYTKKGSIFRELGDFLAHPKEKDRGLVLSSVRSAAASFEKDCRYYFQDNNFNPPIFKGLGTLEELIEDMQAIFQLAGIPEKTIDRDDNNCRDFVFCVIFLLGSFKIKLENRLFEFIVEYSHALKLIIRYESKNFPRHFVTLPVLTLANVWSDCPTVLISPKYSLNRHIARRFPEGSLAAISYEDDLSKQLFSTKNFANGKLWPLPDLRK